MAEAYYIFTDEAGAYNKRPSESFRRSHPFYIRANVRLSASDYSKERFRSSILSMVSRLAKKSSGQICGKSQKENTVPTFWNPLLLTSSKGTIAGSSTVWWTSPLCCSYSQWPAYTPSHAIRRRMRCWNFTCKRHFSVSRWMPVQTALPQWLWMS